MKLVTANKLNRFWKNGVVAKMVAKTKILKTMEEVTANTNDENVAGAGVVVELNDKLVSNVSVNSDGKLVVTKGGADTVLPFSKFNSLVYGIPSNLKKGDWVIVAGTYSGSAYHNMQPSNISGGKLIFYADSGGGYTQYVAIIEAIGGAVSFTPGYSETKGTRACLRQ